MVAIYLAPFYLLVCVYILLRSLHWFQVLHTVFQNVWVCRGIGLVYLFVVFSILIAFMAPASGFRRFMKLRRKRRMLCARFQRSAVIM